MDNKLLNELKEKYDEQINKKEEFLLNLNILNERKEILENSPIVKNYIELLKQIEETKLSANSCLEDRIMSELLLQYDSNIDNNTNEIYYYMGSFINEGKTSRLVDRDYTLAEFDRYIDIESLITIDNPIEDRETFEKANKIIFSDTSLYDIHDDFLKDCIISNQDIAIKKVLKRGKNNK